MELCAILLSWALHLSTFETAPGQCPDIESVSHQQLEERACSGRDCKVLGWYPGFGDVIYIDDRLNIEDDLFHSSIVVHEMVHWLQGRAGTLLLDCARSVDAEREAYHVQQLYLTAYGVFQPLGMVLPMLRCAPTEQRNPLPSRVSMDSA